MKEPREDDTHATFAAIAAVAVQDEHLEQGALQALIVQAAQTKLVTSPAGHCKEYGRSHTSWGQVGRL